MKRNRRFIVSVLLLTVVTIAGAAGIVRQGNSVTIHVADVQPNGAKVVCLEVINDNIIRVRATS